MYNMSKFKFVCLFSFVGCGQTVSIEYFIISSFILLFFLTSSFIVYFLLFLFLQKVTNINCCVYQMASFFKSGFKAYIVLFFQHIRCVCLCLSFCFCLGLSLSLSLSLPYIFMSISLSVSVYISVSIYFYIFLHLYLYLHPQFSVVIISSYN